MSFSELKYLFECSYQFKLRFLYGFNAPIHEALGYGKGLHDALSEVHKRALDGDFVTKELAPALIDRHLNAPFAYDALREKLRAAGIKAIERYFDTHGKEIANTEFSEKQIQVHVAPGITVDGRIDLIRRLDTGEVAIVDFKSTERAQAEDVTRDQLHVYAVGYQELTGKSADLIEVLNLDEKGKTTREPVDDPLLSAVRNKIRDAGEALRTNKLPRLPTWDKHACGSCDLVGLCRQRPAPSRAPRSSAPLPRPRQKDPHPSPGPSRPRPRTRILIRAATAAPPPPPDPPRRAPPPSPPHPPLTMGGAGESNGKVANRSSLAPVGPCWYTDEATVCGIC